MRMTRRFLRWPGKRIPLIVSLLVAALAFTPHTALADSSPRQVSPRPADPNPKLPLKKSEPALGNETCSQLKPGGKLREEMTRKARSSSSGQVTGVCLSIENTPPSEQTDKLVGKLRLENSQAPLFPDWCINLPNDGIWYIGDRFQACRKGVTITPRKWRVNSNGTMVYEGSVRVRLYEGAFLPTVFGSGGWDQRAAAVVEWVDGNPSGLTMAGVASCHNAAGIGSNCDPALLGAGFPAQDISSLTSVAEGTILFTAHSLAAGDKSFHHSRIKYQFSVPGGFTVELEDPYTDSPKIRCDNAVPGSVPVGCVFPDFVALYDVPLNGIDPTTGKVLTDYVRHLKEAIGSGLPGGYNPSTYPGGSPLTRVTDRTKRRENGRTACPGRYRRPAGHQCDEYPFRSTYQGARTGNPGYPNNLQPWPARTHCWCQLPDEPDNRTGPDGYSVCMIPTEHNNNGGNHLKAFYDTNRILDKDPYFVRFV